MVSFHYDSWRKQVFSRTDPQLESVPEKFGDYIYFLRQKEFTKGKSEEKVKGLGATGADANFHEIYCRMKHDLKDKLKSEEDGV